MMNQNPSLYPALGDLFAAHRDDFLVYFSTNASSSKLRGIAANPRGCAYYCHPKRWRGVALIGDLDVVADAAVRRTLWHDEWKVYYPGGVDDPDNAVLCLRPYCISGWNGHETFEFVLGSRG